MRDQELFQEILTDIGQLLAEDIRANPNGAFLYAEAGEEWVGASLFKDVGNRVIYRDPSTELGDRILGLWNAAPAGHKWNALLYTINGDQFDARFQYDEDWDPEESEIERRPRALRMKFGDKPVDYSDP